MAGTALKQPGDARARKGKITGTEKAAIVFLCLGEKRGSDLMRNLDDNDIQRITRAMTQLGAISVETVESVMLEFTQQVTNGSGVVGSYNTAESMLRKFLPETQVDEIMKDMRGPAKERDLWKRFGALNETVIANYLKEEHEQTAAAILSNLSSDVAARVLPLLGTERMQNVVERMIGMEAVPLHVLRQIEDTLKNDIMADAAHPTSTEMQQRMADMFNKLDIAAFEEVAEVLEQRAPEPFALIKQRMFTFDDLMKLDQQSLAQIMRGLDGEMLPLALRGAKKEARDYFLGALPARSRDMLIEEMETMGPVRGRDVRAAQGAMVDYARVLAEQEVIRLPSGEDDDLID